MLYGFQTRQKNLEKQKVESYFLKEYTSQSIGFREDIIRTSIKEGVNEIYSTKDIESNFTKALSGSIYTGFQSCLKKQNIQFLEDQLKSDIKTAEAVTLLSYFKNKGLEKSFVMSLYGGGSPSTNQLIDSVYSDSNFNAGSFRLNLWESSVQKIE